MATKPAALFDPIPGNVGLFADDALVMLRFTESDGMQISDAKGNLLDLKKDAGTNGGVRVNAWTGFGRSFLQAGPDALLTSDSPTGNTLLTRDATIQAIVALHATSPLGTAQTVYCRGIHDGTAGEAFSLGLEIVDNAGAGLYDVRFFWEDSAGVIKTQTAGTFQHAGDESFFLLTATRRWEASNKVVLRYYVNDRLLAEVTSVDGDIAGGTTGHTAIGGRKSGGVWSKFLHATIDELRVLNVELSGEEIREIYRRLAIHQPAGVEMFAGLAPPGAPWYRDPSNDVGRHVKVAGQALGLGIAAAEELRALWLPDAAPLATIGRWEKLCGLSPKPLDSLDTRRARVVAFFSRAQGYSVPSLQQAFSGVLALGTADVQILEFSNTVQDSFTAIAAERWLTGTGTWSIQANELKLVVNIGTDIRWEPTREPCHIRMPFAQSGGAWLIAGKLSTYWAALPANTIVGLFVYNRRTNHAIWFGVKYDLVSGQRKLGYVKFDGSTLGAFVPIVVPSLDQAYWLRMHTPVDTGIHTAGAVILEYSTTSATAGFTAVEVANAITDAEWAGFSAMSTDAALAAGLTATFDDFMMRSMNGHRPFYWYVYRNPALAGAPDMIGAEALAQKMKPAHTIAHATESKSVLCDDARDGLCDRGPLGAM